MEAIVVFTRDFHVGKRIRSPHPAAEQPGDVVCLNTFSTGKLKGVAQAWHYAAYSYAAAEVGTEHGAESATRFLHHRVVPAC